MQSTETGFARDRRKPTGQNEAMTENSENALRKQAEAIWRAGVDAVDSERLVAGVVDRQGETLSICGHAIDVSTLGKLVVVGAGKAGAGMAAAFEQAIGDDVLGKFEGWVNVPENCVRSLRRIHLHAARPAGVNEPTEAGVAGSRRILEMVGSLTARDVCVVLLSGGGSALLPAPPAAVGLANKQAVTRLLMESGAPIQDLNCVRKQLSEIKGGRLARACNAGLLITLIISDVIGDPLDVIASGPTVDDPRTPQDALEVLARHDRHGAVPSAVTEFLERAAVESRPFPAVVHNHVIGNNGIALQAAAEEATRRGFAVRSLGSENAGIARYVGTALADMAVAQRNEAPGGVPVCILSGGEPVVNLVPTDRPRKGGRNQELVLAALDRLWDAGLDRMAILSGGTDGEDGPTDAAGAVADADVLAAARSAGLKPAEFLAINNAYPFFEQTAGLLKTGPTHTNVMDLRVVLIG